MTLCGLQGLYGFVGATFKSKNQILIMKEGDVILTPIPQADGRVKNRPAIFLREMPLYGDLLVCGISTQLHHYVSGFDEIITPADIDFGASALPL
jgi:mRNA interferase MazF